jgi:hypothetical protein
MPEENKNYDRFPGPERPRYAHIGSLVEHRKNVFAGLRAATMEGLQLQRGGWLSTAGTRQQTRGPNAGYRTEGARRDPEEDGIIGGNVGLSIGEVVEFEGRTTAQRKKSIQRGACRSNLLARLRGVIMTPHVRDFPFTLKIWLIVIVLLFGINVLFFSVSAVTIAASLLTNPLVSGLAGAVVGVGLSFVVPTFLDRIRREKEKRDVSESLYNEIADRAARCLNDYLDPWRDGSKFTCGDAVKFRPVERVVYRAVAAKLGLLPPTTVFWVLRFYYTLDALERAIDDLKNDFKYRADITQERARFVTQRFKDTLHPALEALLRLGYEVTYYGEIDQQVALVYPHVEKEGGNLRTVLATAIEQHCIPESSSGSAEAVPPMSPGGA